MEALWKKSLKSYWLRDKLYILQALWGQFCSARAALPGRDSSARALLCSKLETRRAYEVANCTVQPKNGRIDLPEL